MATIGQVVYNLQDFHSSGGLISTMKGSTSSTITWDGTPSGKSTYESGRLDIFSTDLVSLFGSSTTGFSKVGIQAPPGTKVTLNDNKTIMIGRTGVYELDEDITITKMQFIRPYKYIIDDPATKAALSSGILGFEEAEAERTSRLATLNEQYPDASSRGEAYWSEYTTIQDAYQEKYEAALLQYTSGVNGIYKLPNEDDPTSSENYEEVYNIIVDFVY